MKATYKKISHIIVFGLMLLFFAPTVAKFNHLLEAHKHEACHHPKKLHYHEVDIDCEFYKFKLNQEFHFNVISFELITNTFETLKRSIYYQPITDKSSLSYTLRGPPIFVMYT